MAKAMQTNARRQRMIPAIHQNKPDEFGTANHSMIAPTHWAHLSRWMNVNFRHSNQINITSLNWIWQLRTKWWQWNVLLRSYRYDAAVACDACDVDVRIDTVDATLGERCRGR